MTRFRYSQALRRMLLTGIFCAIGFGFTRLPAILVDDMARSHGAHQPPATAASPEDASSRPVIRALRTVVDPELGLNIVDLGLIREIVYLPPARLTISMVPTSPRCPFLKQMVADIEQAVAPLVPAGQARVEVDRQRRWTPDDLTPAGRRHFFGRRP